MDLNAEDTACPGTCASFDWAMSCTNGVSLARQGPIGSITTGTVDAISGEGMGDLTLPILTGTACGCARAAKLAHACCMLVPTLMH